MQLVLHAPRWQPCQRGSAMAGLKVMRPRRVHFSLLACTPRPVLHRLSSIYCVLYLAAHCPLPPLPPLPPLLVFESLCCCLAASAPPHHARLVRSNSFTPAGSPLFGAVVISLPHLAALGRSCLSTFHPSRAAKSPRSPAVLQAAPSTRTHDTPTPTPTPTTPSRRRCVPPCIRPGTCRERTMTHPPTPRPANKL
jgi:hypothetical protein